MLDAYACSDHLEKSQIVLFRIALNKNIMIRTCINKAIIEVKERFLVTRFIERNELSELHCNRAQMHRAFLEKKKRMRAKWKINKTWLCNYNHDFGSAFSVATNAYPANNALFARIKLYV